jgi:signal transduction histidine kinase
MGNTETVSKILYFRDVTREKELERMKSEFLSTAAHELRTPMASIYGFAEVLLGEEFDVDTRRELLTIIYTQSELMSSILNELLDLARIEARRGKDFVIEEVNLLEVAASTVAGFKVPDQREPPQSVVPVTAFFVNADRSKLRQALSNLISNAYKYSPNGGSVTIRYRKDMESKPPMIGIEVQDEGIGMTPEQVLRVCERFYRADTSGKIPGTGLGMSIVKEIVEFLHGRIDIKSALHQGTTVTIWLPECLGKF